MYLDSYRESVEGRRSPKGVVWAPKYMYRGAPKTIQSFFESGVLIQVESELTKNNVKILGSEYSDLDHRRLY